MAAFKIKPYRLINKIQHYAWGTRNEQAFIPRLIGKEPQANVPYAELWMGVHPNAPSEVETESGRQSLIHFIQTHPIEILGQRVADTFHNQLPFLFKVLSAGEALSIQAHPNKQQAERLHKLDPEHYPDDNHKPEIAIALDHLIALVGFCAYDKLEKTLQIYPEISDFIGLDKVAMFSKSMGEAKQEAFKRLFDTLMSKSLDDTPTLEQELTRLERRLQTQKNLTEKEALFLELRQKYGTDIGLFVIFLLNLVHLNKGQGVFLKAGVPHAYVRGNIVECMANSDNVVRAGLTPKFKDVKTLVDILTYETGDVEIFDPEPTATEFTYRVPVPEFSITHWNLSSGDRRQRYVQSIEILLVVHGQIELAFDEDRMFLKQGESVVIPAALKRYKLRAEETAEVFCAFVPDSTDGERVKRGKGAV